MKRSGKFGSRDSSDAQALRSSRLYEGRQVAAIAARWDARAAEWDSTLNQAECHLNEDAAYARFLRQVHRVIESRRAFCRRHGVIDAGCGTGLVLAEVLSSFAWGIGVDVSRQMLAMARRKRIPNARFLQGDCFRIAALCPKAGAVLSRGVLLSHYGRQHSEALLRAAKEALVPRGFLIFDFLNQAARSKFQHAPEEKAWFSAEEILAQAQRAGLGTARVLGGGSRRVLVLVASK